MVFEIYIQYQKIMHGKVSESSIVGGVWERMSRHRSCSVVSQTTPLDLERKGCGQPRLLTLVYVQYIYAVSQF